MTNTKTKLVQLPPDIDGMNDDRSKWAAAAISTFAKKTRVDPEDAICDLLADIMHWCDRSGMDFEHELERAKNHYDAETMTD